MPSQAATRASRTSGLAPAQLSLAKFMRSSAAFYERWRSHIARARRLRPAPAGVKIAASGGDSVRRGLLGLLHPLGRALLRLLAGLGLFGVVAGSAGQEALVGEVTEHAVGRRRALGEPGLGGLEVDVPALGRGLVEHRVVGADLLDEAAVARRARVGDDDGVERALLGATTGKADLQGHDGFSRKGLVRLLLLL